MDVKIAIHERRAYRALEKTEITDELIEDLAKHAQLSPSCYNNQPWNFVFVDDKEMLEKMQDVISPYNEWTKGASLIIAVFSKSEDDCEVDERSYHLFDTGMAAGFLQLRATELGLVAHPIAGYDEEETKELLDIPEEYRLITLINVGKHADEPTDYMTEDQIETEKERPEREDPEEFVYRDKYEK
ncbi:MAG: nitroreductase family protein [Candidatus Thermoplasmatota archaeon]|nr:nitroreductase family protein [Candidatus Thermoplasmatota archaeon]MBS3790883.1 nitroreductase family protein [Candidatus Thermoplasmatota archaeon]